MDLEYLLWFGREALSLVLLLSGPAMAASLGVGLLVSLFQATTQIQEMTLSYVPKIVAVFFIHVVLGAWVIAQMVTFARGVFESMPQLVGG